MLNVVPWILAVMAAFVVGPWTADGPEPPAPACLALTFSLAAAPLVLGEILGRVSRRRAPATFERFAGVFPYLAAAAAAAAFWRGGWAAWLAARWPDAPSSLRVAALEAPAAVAIAAAIFGERRLFAADRRFHAPRLRDRVRLALLPVAAPVALAALLDIAFLYRPFRVAFESFEGVQLAVVGALAAAALCVAPLLLSLVIPIRSLHDGPLRAAFEEVARRLGVSVRDYKVAYTQETIANAAMVGGLGPRVVLVTDRLLLDHPHEELVAVVGHELGHARARHLSTLLLFVATLTVLALVVPDVVSPLIGDVGATGLGLVALALALRFGFGPVSRLCEHEADLYGALAVGSPEPLAASLERIAGATRRRSASWRHPSIDARLRFLARALIHPRSASRPKRLLARIRWLLVVCLCLGSVGLGFRLASRWPEERAVAALRRGDFTEVVRATEARPDPALEPWNALARRALGSGITDAEGFRGAAHDALERGDSDAASGFAKLAYLRGDRPSDGLLADFAESLHEGDSPAATRVLAGPGSYIRHDPRLGPAARRLLDAPPSTQPTTKPRRP